MLQNSSYGCWGAWSIRAGLLVTATVMWGCGSQSDPAGKATSKYEAADDAEVKQGDQAGASKRPSAGDNIPSAAGGAADAARNSSTAAPPKPSAIPSSQLGGSDYTVPEGTVEELLAFISALEERQPSGRTREEHLQDFQKIQQARILAAEKILAGNASDEARRAAVESKFDSLRALGEVDVPGVNEHIREFSQSLRQDKNPDLARLGRLMLFGMQLGEIAEAGDQAAPQEIQQTMTEFKALLAEEGKHEEVFAVTRQAAMALHLGGHKEQASEAFRLIGQTFQNHENPQLAAAAAELTEQAKLVELDFESKLEAALLDQPDAMPALMAVVQQLLADGPPGRTVLSVTTQAAQYLEITKHYAEAGEIYSLVGTAFADHPDQELADQAQAMIENGRRRVGLIGKPFVVEGVHMDGKPLDWSKYQGKVVLVDFWATWCGPCLREFPNIRENYDRYHEQGFEVVGVNLDDDRSAVERFFATQQFPWDTVFSADPEANGFENPLAVHCGIDAIPFIVLVNREGIAVDLHVRGPELDKKLSEMLAAPGGAEVPRAAPGAPALGTGAALNQPAHSQRHGRDEVHFVSYRATDPEDTETNAAAVDEQSNPYSPPTGLSAAELTDFILDMQEKPKSIQARAGFAEAILQAADQILAADAKDREQVLAAQAKIEILHKKACLGDEQADEQLQQFVLKIQDDSRPAIAKQVRFLSLERQTLQADQLSPEQVRQLLTALEKFFNEEQLINRHLRIASGTVRAINQLEDGEEREKHFTTFGNLFAKSTDRDLARYGTKLAKSSVAAQSNLVGKPLELTGVTALGTVFDWESYRGKVVLVDFWATWCGPCRAAMPQVKALLETNKGRGFEIVGVSLDKDLDALGKYLEEQGIDWENLAGPTALGLAETHNVRGIPTLMLVDEKGNVVAVSHKIADLAGKLELLLEKIEPLAVTE